MTSPSGYQDHQLVVRSSLHTCLDRTKPLGHTFLVASKIHDNNHLQKMIIVMLTGEDRSVGVGHNLGEGTLPEDVFSLQQLAISPY